MRVDFSGGCKPMPHQGLGYHFAGAVRRMGGKRMAQVIARERHRQSGSVSHAFYHFLQPVDGNTVSPAVYKQGITDIGSHGNKRIEDFDHGLAQWGLFNPSSFYTHGKKVFIQVQIILLQSADFTGPESGSGHQADDCKLLVILERYIFHRSILYSVPIPVNPGGAACL